MCPLEKQEEFCVPELLEKKAIDGAEETVECEDADVTELVSGMYTYYFTH